VDFGLTLTLRREAAHVVRLTLPLLENEGFSPEFIYERRSLSSKNELDLKDFEFINPLIR
jgi:hypothetical protein